MIYNIVIVIVIFIIVLLTFNLENWLSWLN